MATALNRKTRQSGTYQAPESPAERDLRHRAYFWRAAIPLCLAFWVGIVYGLGGLFS